MPAVTPCAGLSAYPSGYRRQHIIPIIDRVTPASWPPHVLAPHDRVGRSDTSVHGKKMQRSLLRRVGLFGTVENILRLVYSTKRLQLLTPIVPPGIQHSRS